MIGGQISHYRVLQLLGRGGMGEVYLAEDTRLSRRVAIKVLPESRQQDPVARQRLLREARAAAALNHPNSCTVHEVVESDDRACIVMEFVDGRTLASHPQLAMPDVLRLFDQVAAALAEAHGKGILHRDLKPSNIMVTRQGQAKVMDFGLAAESTLTDTVTLTNLTASGTTMGTLAYMAPEQLERGVADVRSDIFAFGVALHEALAGVHPFARATPVATAAAILTESPAPLPRELPAWPALDRIMTRLLAKDSDARYQSMHEVQAALAIVRSEPARTPVLTRTIRGARRHWRLSLAAIAMLAVGVWALAEFWPPATPPLAFAERDWIVVADFDNRTGDPVFDRSLDTAMTVSIQQSKYVNVWPRTRIQRTLALMRKADAPPFDDAVAREVAVRDGLKAVLVPRINKVGDAYVLTAELVDPASQTIVASGAARASDRNGVLDALDELARQMRSKLGESLASIASQRVALPLATTSSLEALKALADSRKPQGVVKPLLEQAIELDSDFAMAHADLGVWHYSHQEREAGERHFTRALGLLDRLTYRERLWITAAVEDWRGNRDEGIRQYRAYVAQYPDDALAWFRLGYAYLLGSQYAMAVKAFEQQLALDPSDSRALVNLATALNALQENERAVAAYQRAFDVNPTLRTGFFVNGEYGFLLARMGRNTEATECFQWMLPLKEVSYRARGLRSLALLSMYRGRYAEAVRPLEDAAGLNRIEKIPLSELRDHLYLAAVHRTRGLTAAANRELDLAMRMLRDFKAGVFYVAATGTALARSGRVNDAATLVPIATARLGDAVVVTGMDQSNRADRAAVAVLQGEIELARHRTDAAIALFQEAERLSADSATEPLARAHLERGNLDAAIPLYRRLIERRMPAVDASEASILAHVALGHIFETRRDIPAATREYAALLEFWKDADTTLPVIVQTRQRLARLNQSAAVR
jgi:serine/threonine protein kinase/tetratricopeptide (TPR) repeat protein